MTTATDGKTFFEKTISLASALLTGENVSAERMQARVAICAKCDKVRNDGKYLRCGICGCKVKGDRGLVNLARYAETSKYGCKHPKGSRWKANGV